MGWVIAVAVVSIVVIFFIVMWFVAWGGYRKLFNRRYNGNPHVRYFHAEDFAGLTAEAVSFVTEGGWTLRGNIYRYGAEPPRALIVFSHGFGAGHLAYTTEINTLARAGFWVLAYDGTGCVSSDGTIFRGFDQGPLDFAAALRFAASDDRLKDLKRVAVGHSWGGFSVLNGMHCGVPVCGVAEMCGFISCAGVMSQSAFGRVQPFAAVFSMYFRVLNRLRFGKCANRDALRALKAERDLPLLLIYGKHDRVVPYYGNGAKILRAVVDQPNVCAVLCEDKGHNVYLTCEAEKYMNETFASISKKSKKNPSMAKELYARADYRKMTEEDPEVMEKIVGFCLRVTKE